MLPLTFIALAAVALSWLVATMRPCFDRKLFARAFGWALLMAGIAGAEEGQKPIGIFGDRSGSMEDQNRLGTLKESIKLLIACLDDDREIILVPFNHEARPARFTLKTPADRQAAFAFVDSWRADGGTKYVTALESIKLAPGMPCVFVSDGLPEEKPEAIFTALKAQGNPRLHTIAVATSPEAKKLLAEMASSTGGSAVSVDNSAALVQVFLELAQHLGNYRSYQPTEERVELKAVRGRLIALGFDATPRISQQQRPMKPSLEHTARLPGEHVALSTVELGTPADVMIEALNKRAKGGHLGAVFLSGLARSELDLNAPAGVAPANGVIRVRARFTTADGKLIDPRQVPTLSARFQVLDSSRKELVNIKGKPSADQPVLEAELPLPATGPVTIVMDTTDAAGGKPFRQTRERTLQLEKAIPLIIRPSPVKLTTTDDQFTVEFRWELARKLAQSPKFSIGTAGATAGLQVQRCTTDGDVLKIEVSARPGAYQGDFTIVATASEPIERARVPFDITVRRKPSGLIWDKANDWPLGTIRATGGSVSAAFSVETKDGEALDYLVEPRDLAAGGKVIALRADKESLRPVKDRPANLKLTADVGNVPAGDYAGAVVLKRGGDSWEAKVTLRVEEPLSVGPIDFGKVAPGQVRKLVVPVKHVGAQAIGNLTLEKPKFDVEGDAVDVALTPEKIDGLPAGAERQLTVSIAVGAKVKTRGPVSGTLLVERVVGQKIRVPVKLSLVDEVNEAAQIVAAPAQVELTGNAGEILRGDLRVKFSADASTALDTVQIELGSFTDEAAKSVNIDATVKFAGSGGTLSKATPVEASLAVIAPSKPGDYRGIITIRAERAGALRVPLTLHIR